MLEAISFGIKDFIDIAVVVFLVYQAYRLVRGTVAVNIFIGIAALFLLWKLVEALQMTLLSGILGQFMSIGVLALVILFQQEIRRFLMIIGTNNFFVKHLFSRMKRKSNIPEKLDVKEISAACFEMAKTRTGALIVIKKSVFDLNEATVGDVQNIIPTQSILESIFYKNSPLHDGAIVIENGRIVATRVILPVSRDKNLPEEYGTRHRAAVGICEKSDAACIVVSEERGKVSYIKGDTIEVMKDEKELTTHLSEELEL
ncbi:MAG: diadenylate cyclase [Flavobacteriales bacterium]|nr:diadenylate cyclase [Flavobacteriales bacterium]